MVGYQILATKEREELRVTRRAIRKRMTFAASLAGRVGAARGEDTAKRIRGARHLLLGLLSLGNDLMRQVFARFGKEMVSRVTDVARKSLKPARPVRRPLPEDENWQAVVKRAERTAAQEGDSLVTEADLATALLETPSQVDKVLVHCGLTRHQCLETLREVVEGGSIPSVWHSSGFGDRRFSCGEP